MIDINAQIRCVGREIGLRIATYPKFVKAGRMTQEEADHELAAMHAVHETLKKLKAMASPKV